MTIRALGPVSSATGIAIDLDLSTISIGFSKTVSSGRMGIANVWLSAVRGRSLSVSVMSASGVACNSEGSGDCDGCGVGNGGGSSGVLEERPPRTGALFRFRGDALLEGDSGSGCAVSSGSRISEGSMFSFATVFLARPPVRGVLATAFVVFRLDAGAFRGLRLGAGVKSSPLSSSILGSIISSSSSESTTAFRLVAAARLEGLTGDSDILKNCTRSPCSKADVFVNDALQRASLRVAGQDYTQPVDAR